MIDLGTIGAVMGATGLAGVSVLFVGRELRLARQRRDARERIRRRQLQRWPS